MMYDIMPGKEVTERVVDFQAYKDDRYLGSHPVDSQDGYDPTVFDQRNPQDYVVPHGLMEVDPVYIAHDYLESPQTNSAVNLKDLIKRGGEYFGISLSRREAIGVVAAIALIVGVSESPSLFSNEHGVSQTSGHHTQDKAK
jgi:hypothetical protein